MTRYLIAIHHPDDYDPSLEAVVNAIPNLSAAPFVVVNVGHTTDSQQKIFLPIAPGAPFTHPAQTVVIIPS